MLVAALDSAEQLAWLAVPGMVVAHHCHHSGTPCTRLSAAGQDALVHIVLRHLDVELELDDHGL